MANDKYCNVGRKLISDYSFSSTLTLDMFTNFKQRNDNNSTKTMIKRFRNTSSTFYNLYFRRNPHNLA